ncbi:hypothetical protein [Namhaeicola litoreus]|uniref:Uncharacterized protein n=1 Tax=Namhaeicola litoreus TaxID=1052145 RepID=A0ABW3Y0U9_9FLAO
MYQIRNFLLLALVSLLVGFKSHKEIGSPDQNEIASTYYENLTKLFEYYAPQFGNKGLLRPVFGEKVISDYVESINIENEQGERIHLFQLPKSERELFYEKWIPSETGKMVEKFKLDKKGNWVKEIKRINKIYKRKYPTQKTKSIDTLIDDPFSRIMIDLDVETKPEMNLKGNQSNTEFDFWAETFNSVADQSIAVEQDNFKMSSQEFIDKIRPAIKKGRILVALPNGDYTGGPGVLFRSGHWYDVGHVAIIKRDGENIPAIVSDTLSFTIGINSVEQMHDESLHEDWAYKHGRAYVLQVIVEKWRFENGEFKLTTSEADNNLLFEEALKLKYAKYCSIGEVFRSKEVAPQKLICSSASWIYAKNALGIDIDIPFNRTIWPEGILKSNFTKVVAKTW